jgi:hypothetical protein
MSISEDFRTYALTQATITAVVGSRIVQAPVHIDAPLPLIVFRRGSALTDPVLSGAGGLTESQLDVECVADTQDRAEDLSDVLHGLIQAYRGTWGSSSILGVFVESQTDDYQFMADGNDQPLYSIASLVRIFHRAA